MDYLVAAVAFVVSLGTGALALRWGPRLGYVDQPDDPRLKAHSTPAVPLGGVALFAAFHAASAVAGVFDLWVLTASVVVLLLGLIDDRRGLSPITRLGSEAVAGTILGLGLGQGSVGIVMVAALVVVAVNAVNLFDGLDGLAGGAGLVGALGVAALAVVRGVDPVEGLILAAALAGFLAWNWHPARLFLGDNGAYVLGLILVAAIARTGPDVVELGLAAGLLGVFVLDLVVTVLRRLVGRRPLFGGDRNHLYDLLRGRGFSVTVIALVAALAEAVWAVAVLVAASLGSTAWSAAVLVVTAALMLAPLAVSGMLGRAVVR